MKSNNVTYIYPKATNYLSAAVELNGKYLVLGNADMKIFEEYGCFFPGCRQNKSYDDISYLKEQLYQKYGLKIVVQYFIGDVVVKDRKGKFSCLYLYKCIPASREIKIDTKKVNAHFISPSDFRHYKFDTADGLLAERISIFHLVYEGMFAKSKRTKNENDQALLLYDSLLYFKDRVATQDVLDFQALIRTIASMDEIKDAYNFICKRNSLQLKEYIEYKKRNK